MSEWILKAKNCGIDLSNLHQDKEKMWKDLKSRNLPVPKTYTIKADEITGKRVQKIFQKTNCFCRLIPKNKDAIRPYNLKLTSVDEFQKFCSKYNLSEYTIQLLEKQNITHSGTAIIKKEFSIIEVVKGDGPNMTHGLKIPITIVIRRGKIKYVHKQPTVIQKNIINKVKNYVKNKQGYYEFDVQNNKTILFRNYQPKNTPWTNIEETWNSKSV